MFLLSLGGIGVITGGLLFTNYYTKNSQKNAD